MLVSVIVPVYNVEKYVGECIESILNQTYKDIEILLIDDGSSDNSKKICEEYVQKDERVHYFLKEHSGLSATRDYGISKCRGDFFIFVDSDDTIKPELIEKVLPLFIEDVDVVAYGMESPDDGYVLRDVQDGDFFLEKYSDRIDFIMNVLLESKIFFSVCNKMYRKNLFVEHDIHPVSDVIIGEDLAINLQVFTFARRVRAIHDKLYEYWLRDDSLMNRDKEHTYYFTPGRGRVTCQAGPPAGAAPRRALAPRYSSRGRRASRLMPGQVRWCRARGRAGEETSLPSQLRRELWAVKNTSTARRDSRSILPWA